jgi:hypothetical protein
MESDVSCRRVSIESIELLKQAKEMLGDQYWLFVGMTFLGLLIGQAAPLGILLGPMLCGLYLCYMQQAGGKPVGFELMFKGFDYFTESLIATLIAMGVSLVVTLPVGIIGFVIFVATMAATDGEAAPFMFALFPFMYLAMLGLMILATMPFLFTYPLIVERGLRAIPAIKTSWTGVKANFGGLLRMVLLYTLISIIASCFCYIPAILFLPLSIGGIFLAYRQIFPLDGKAFA